MFKQMQELQRKQQLQQLEAVQRNAMNRMSTFPKQLAGQQSQPINGNPWQSQVTAGGTNWQQREYPSAVHPYSDGLIISPEQGRSMGFLGLIPQKGSQSYGVPVSNAGGTNLFSQNSMDKPGFFSQDTSYEHASSQGLENAVNLEGFDQAQKMKVSMLDGGGQGFVSGSDISLENSSVQAAASQPTSSQAAVGLNPTEEKILFGNDDSIWEAFGGAPVTGNDGADLLNGFPSMQSGTWSALMKSAVAETSSSDVGIKEEWSGLESQNSRSQSGNQPLPISQDYEKPSPAWFDSSQRASLGMRTTSNDVSANNATLYTNYLDNPRLQQPFSNQRSSPTESQHLRKGRRWLDNNSPKPHTEEKRVLENPNSSRNLSKIDAGFGSHCQNSFLPESIPDSNINAKVDGVGPGLININMSHESSQRPPDNHSLDLCKPGMFTTKSDMNKGQSVLDWSANTPGDGVSEVHAPKNGNGRENDNDSRQNSFFNHALAGSSRENVWSDAGDQHFLPGAQDYSSGYDGRRVPVVRKFQNYPLGDVDESSSAKQVSPTHTMSSSSGLEVYEAQQTQLGPAGSSSSDMEKGKICGFHGDAQMLHGSLPSIVHPGYLPSTSAPFTKSSEYFSPNQPLSPSQNMLELLQKVDQSKDQNAASNLGSTNYSRSSDIPAGGSIGPGQSWSSTSHGFNLQLEPPQGIALSNLNDPSQCSLRSVGSPSSTLVPSEKEDKTHAWLPSGPSAQCLPPLHRPPQMGSGKDNSGGLDGSQSNLMGKLSASLASNSTYLRIPFQNQQTTVAGGPMMLDHQYSIVSSDRHDYHDQQLTNFQNQIVANQSVSNLHNNLASERENNQSGMKALMHQMPPSMHAVMAGMRKDNMSLVRPYLWTSQPQMLGSQAQNVSGFLKSHLHSTDASDMNSFSQQKKDELDGARSLDAASSQGVAGGQELTHPRSSGKTIGESQEESLGTRSMEASPPNSTASQKDADVFHHSVKSNSMAHHSYPLLHQMQPMKTMDMDPSHWDSMRLRSPENGPDASQMAGNAQEPSTGGMNSMVRDPSVSQTGTTVSSGDAKVLSFTAQSNNINISSRFQHGAVASHDTFSFGHSDFQKYVTSNITSRAQLTGVSPQMAASWFEQYGTSRNGQLLPVRNVPSVPSLKNVEQQFVKSPSNLAVRNSVQLENAITDTFQIDTRQITKACSANEQVSPLRAFVPHFSSSSPVSMRPKKRKTSSSDLIPWNKEIRQGFKRIQNISSVEVDWAQSSNRLVERGGDETESHEHIRLIVRPRRRLILTTKLLQQVFCPLSASILSLDGRSNYEVIIYSNARLGLGDACNLICGVESDLLPDNGNSKAKASERIRDQYFSKVMDDFTKRVKELENDLLRLDRCTSILDFRWDCQDLERFSVINHFARFHGRSQVDGVRTSSSSDANAISLKPYHQRYVTAHAMPITVPERVQCLTIN